jgi:spoIIIJ-associated protein
VTEPTEQEGTPEAASDQFVDPSADAAESLAESAGETSAESTGEAAREPTAEDGEGAESGRRLGAPTLDPALLEQEGEIAADYIEALLDVADLDGDIDMDVESERALVSVVGGSLDQLVGPRGEVLEALQELTRLAVLRQTGVRSRLMVDIGGWRVRRRDELAELGRRTAEQVAASGESVRLDPMTPFERKAVHDAVSDIAGVATESEGEEPQRRIVISRVAETSG